MLKLDDPRWDTLEGGYHIPYNPVPALKRLQVAKSAAAQSKVYKEFWEELHHQGDLGVCSYACVPQLVRIARVNPPKTYDFFALITVIEVERHEKGNPRMPSYLKAEYTEAWSIVSQLISSTPASSWDVTVTQTACAALAASKGQRILARAYLEMNTDGALRFLREETGYEP
ncbi:hypothetical protein [Prosthecobacter sp.]|uniref:hypothetical protein n=1 Tax=Prosthecobacter sp. TaxID=1965333 RepID=UPI002ABBDF93|nr:hypothetical protein [Prosthecobacter sp.]MDZ4402836.1 hypothetical protein [Prosthecobacter sp.]